MEQRRNQAQTYPQFLLKTLSSNRVKAHSPAAYRPMDKNWSIRRAGHSAGDNGIVVEPLHVLMIYSKAHLLKSSIW